MALNRFFFVLLFFFLTGGFVAASSSSSSSFISDEIFESHGFNGRTLLQTAKGCTVNFEFLNYTIITSQCKGPQYPPKLCCAAFKEFACPYAEQINDLTTNCASTMFSYINLYGKYPPGLFANQCREQKEGLECSAVPPTSAKDSANTNSGNMVSTHSPFLMLAAGFLVFLFQLF